MQSKPELSSTIQQGFLSHSENTMGAELGANVGLVLLKLASHFSDKPANPSQAIISPGMVDGYFEALSEKVKEQDEETQEAWLHVKTQVEKNVNVLDKITIYLNGEEQIYCFDLKTSLALVYAALTDKEAFWAAEKKQLSSKKEIITARGDFETRYVQDEADRLATLWNCFKDLQTKNICHTGIRNDLVMTLNGTYPDLWFIESVDAFLYDLIAEHIHQQIDAQQADPEQHRETILAEMSHERSESLGEALEESESDLRQAIEQALAEHGTNPKNCSKKIDDALAAIEDIHLSFEDNTLMSSLSFLLKPSFKAEDKQLSVVKDWINNVFEFGNDLQAEQVISFAKVQKSLILFKKYQAALRGWNEDLISGEQLEQLSAELRAYSKRCLQESSPQQITVELDLAMQRFEKACEAFKLDSQYGWIENFFSQWAMAEADDDQETLIKLYSKLYDSTMQEKYLVTTAYLESQFPRTAKEVEVTPYLINRLFLHALVVHPEEWKPDFFYYLKVVYDFVAQELSDEKQDYGAQVLKRDSYPRALMAQLLYLQDYFDLQGTPDESKKINFYIPMRQLLLTVKQFAEVFFYLSEDQKQSFIDSLGKEFLKSMVKNLGDLFRLLKPLSETQIASFTGSLDAEFLESIIPHSGALHSLLVDLSADQKNGFISSVEHGFLKSKIKDCEALGLLLWNLSVAQIPVFIDSMGDQFLESMIKNSHDLNSVLKNLPRAQKEIFLGLLDHDFLKSLIKNRSDFSSVLCGLSETQFSAFVSSIDTEFFNAIIKNHGDMFWVLMGLPLIQKQVFLAVYSDLQLISTIKGFCNNPENKKDVGLEKMDTIINNPDLGLREKINQVISLAEARTSESGGACRYNFFAQDTPKGDSVEDFYRNLVALKVGTQEATKGFLNYYSSGGDSGQNMLEMKSNGG